MLQLKHGAQSPALLVPGTVDALAELAQHNLMNADEAQWWTTAYLHLRRVESGLRLLNTTERHDLPCDPAALHDLSFLLNVTQDRLERESLDIMAENRKRFNAWFVQESNFTGETP